MNTEAYRKNIEKQILQLLEQQLLSGKMNAPRAKKIAQYILDSLRPNMSLDDIYKFAESFDKHFSELIPLMLPIVNEYEEKNKKVILEQVSILIKENKIAEATNLLKKADYNKDIVIT